METSHSNVGRTGYQCESSHNHLFGVLSIQVPQNRGKQNNDTVTTVVPTPLWIKPCSCISFCYSSPSESGWNGSSSRYDCRRSVVYLLLLLLLSSSHIRGDTGYDAGTYIDIVHLHVKSKFNLHLDIVIWDSHPLALGATPRQVYIDGIPQLENPQELTKLSKFQTLPKPKLGQRS